MPDPINLPGWVKWLLKMALKAIIKRAYKQLISGLWVKISYEGDILHIFIKLEDNPPPIIDYLHLE